MRHLIILILVVQASWSFGQRNRNEIYGNWVLVNFEIDSVLVFDKRNPANVVDQHMEILKIINPNFTNSDSIEYANQIISQTSSFQKYTMSFFKNGTYHNTKLTRGRTTNEKEEGKFEVVKSSQRLIQTDSKQRTTESIFQLNDKILKLFMHVGGKSMTMTFEKRK
jgi:hypothetical protein